MISTQQQVSVSSEAPGFAILALDPEHAAADWRQSEDLRGFDVHTIAATINDRQITALSSGYQAIFVAGFGAQAAEALALAARFPDEIHGVVLFQPAINHSPLQEKLNQAISLVHAAFGALGIFAGPKCANPSSFGSVVQPVLIFQNRTGPKTDIKVAATLQRELGGPVEVQFVGPKADVERLSLLDPALNRRCAAFTARVAAGAEGRRAKRQMAAAQTSTKAAVKTPAKTPKVLPRPARNLPNYPSEAVAAPA